MNHRDHVNLISRAVPDHGGGWADLGSGEGAFTLALRELIGAEGEIWSIDRDRRRLDTQREQFRAQFPSSNVHFVTADFTRPLELPLLDGIVMANSLHFVQNKEPVLRQVRKYLKENGRFVLVEYNADNGNIWVPYPLSFPSFRALALRSGLAEPRLTGTIPSHFLREIYSALALNPAR